jgi:acyl-CoA synthetase (AMP-forming)/AMP-acid ligase II
VHALWKLTVPLALLSSYSTPFELEHQLRTSRATTLFVHPNALDRALLVAEKLGLSTENIYILEGSVPGRLSIEDLVQRTKDVPTVPSRPAGKDTLAYLVFSSGTSGLPKGAPLCVIPCVGMG